MEISAPYFPGTSRARHEGGSGCSTGVAMVLAPGMGVTRSPLGLSRASLLLLIGVGRLRGDLLGDWDASLRVS